MSVSFPVPRRTRRHRSCSRQDGLRGSPAADGAFDAALPIGVYVLTATITGGTTLTPTITMPTLDATLAAAGYSLRNRTEVLPISPRIQGKLALTLTVTGGGFIKTGTVTTSAAEPTNAILDVPVGINVFFQGAESATYGWTLTPPSGSTATLRNLDDATGHYGGSCLSCHTVGNSAAAANNGFDDVAAAAGWSFPATLAAGNWASFTSAYPTVARLADIQCENCHGPHDATNPSQLRVYDDVEMLPAGFGVSGVGKGALCMTCHNTRNGVCVPGGTSPCTTLTYWTHDDAAPASLQNSYSGPHTAAQADVLMGQNAFFVGRGGYSPSGHAAIADTCVACHMAASEFGEGYGDHTWTIGEETCASCHGEGVTGEATEATVEMRLVEIEDAIANAVIGDVAGIVGGGGSVSVRAWDEATDCYSSSSSSTSNVVLGAVPTAATAAHIHGQTGFCFTMPSAVTWTRTGTGCSGDVTGTNVCFQVAALKTGSPLAPVLATTDVLIKAAWNVSLIANDASGGIHNPTWVFDVLRATYEAILAR